MGFWQNVSGECEYKGISRKELAAAVHFSVNTISSGIKRDGMPEADLALRIANALGVPLETLLSMPVQSSKIDPSKHANEKRLLKIYSPYIKKMEAMPQAARKAIFTIIDSVKGN